jgi:exodeoxyribonuclease VII large subunit
MAKPLQSQWEFGELFPEKPLRRVLSVSEFTQTVKRLLEQHVGRVWVTGQLSNLRVQSSGHLYFTIKDAGAQLQCVLFRGDARSFDRSLLRDGLTAVLHGDLTVYEPRGQYQLVVSAVELQGVGALQAAFEKLKQKLLAEGLFSSERKRPLPRFPRRIGLVTSPTGAAIRDVLHVMRRRHPGMEVLLAYCRVQGLGAAEEIACAIELLNEWSGGKDGDPSRRIDLILVTRGGGSLEDLWAFNEEPVARAIFNSQIPVVSAVGHEIDFTISDFVADLRAATPSAAAEVITEGFVSSRQFIRAIPDQLRQLVRSQLNTRRESLAFVTQRFRRQHPRRRLREQEQHLDDLKDSLCRAMAYAHRMRLCSFRAACHRLTRLKPSVVWKRHCEAFLRIRERLFKLPAARLQGKTALLASLNAKLKLLSPLNVLDRGYSITIDADTGKVLQSSSDAPPGKKLLTKLKQGQVRSVVAQS